VDQGVDVSRGEVSTGTDVSLRIEMI
jgi:hypothetical protein